MSGRSEFNTVGNRIRKLALDKGKTADLAFFRLEGMDRNCMFGRMDFVESLLRRKPAGIIFRELEVE